MRGFGYLEWSLRGRMVSASTARPPAKATNLMMRVMVAVMIFGMVGLDRSGSGMDGWVEALRN